MKRTGLLAEQALALGFGTMMQLVKLKNSTARRSISMKMEGRSVTFNEPSDIKNAWIAALNSGKYTQTNGALRNSKGYCCLGVLCDVVAPSKWETSLPRAGPDGVSYRLDHFHHSLGRAGEIYP